MPDKLYSQKYHIWKSTHPYVQNNQDLLESEIRLITHTLNERFGVFDYTDKYFLKIFEDIAKQAMSKDNRIDWTHTLVPVYKNTDARYYKYTLSNLDTTKLSEYCDKPNFLKQIQELNIFITFRADVENHTVYTSSLSTDEKNEFHKDIIDDIFNNYNGKITTSIILSYPYTANYEYTPQQIAATLLHELVHIINAITDEQLDINTGNANYIAHAIMKNICNIDRLPTCYDLFKIYNKLKTNNFKFNNHIDLAIFLSICSYYGDTGESYAYLQQFRTNCELAYHKQIEITPDIFLITNKNQFFDDIKSEEYTVYYMLNDIFKNSLNISHTYQYFLTDFDNNDIEPIQKLLLSNKNKTLRSFCKHTSKVVNKFLIRVNSIINDYNEKIKFISHHNNVSEHINNIELNKDNMATPVKAIKYIVEAYIDSIEQMQNTLKQDSQYTKKRTAKSEKNQNITLAIFGPRLFKAYMMHGNMDTFAPVPLSAIHLAQSDIEAIYSRFIADDETLAKFTDKVFIYIKKEYTRQQFVINGEMVHTDIVFRTFDELCDFIATINNAVNKAIKNLPENCINWKPFVTKFRNYLK